MPTCAATRSFGTAFTAVAPGFSATVTPGVLLAATYPADGVAVLRAVAVEALITFLLVFVVMAVATDERVPSTSTAALSVGFALGVGVLIGGPVTGGAVNSARALGPMIVSGDLTDFWVYLVGPIVGGALAALAYDRVVSAAEAPEPPDGPSEGGDGDS